MSQKRFSLRHNNILPSLHGKAPYFVAGNGKNEARIVRDGIGNRQAVAGMLQGDNAVRVAFRCFRFQFDRKSVGVGRKPFIQEAVYKVPFRRLGNRDNGVYARIGRKGLPISALLLRYNRSRFLPFSRKLRGKVKDDFAAAHLQQGVVQRKPDDIRNGHFFAI